MDNNSKISVKFNNITKQVTNLDGLDNIIRKVMVKYKNEGQSEYTTDTVFEDEASIAIVSNYGCEIDIGNIHIYSSGGWNGVYSDIIGEKDISCSISLDNNDYYCEATLSVEGYGYTGGDDLVYLLNSQGETTGSLKGNNLIANTSSDYNDFIEIDGKIVVGKDIYELVITITVDVQIDPY